MDKTIYQGLTQKFESSSGRTPQYLAFHRLFKREFTAYLKECGAREIQFSKPNHFDATGFFTINDQPYYFSLSDLRWSKDTLLIRTAKDYRDYHGGTNQFVRLDSIYSFKADMARALAGSGHATPLKAILAGNPIIA